VRERRGGSYAKVGKDGSSAVTPSTFGAAGVHRLHTAAPRDMHHAARPRARQCGASAP
jgi:hypothetical protein